MSLLLQNLNSMKAINRFSSTCDVTKREIFMGSGYFYQVEMVEEGGDERGTLQGDCWNPLLFPHFKGKMS